MITSQPSLPESKESQPAFQIKREFNLEPLVAQAERELTPDEKSDAVANFLAEWGEGHEVASRAETLLFDAYEKLTRCAGPVSASVHLAQIRKGQEDAGILQSTRQRFGPARAIMVAFCRDKPNLVPPEYRQFAIRLLSEVVEEGSPAPTEFAKATTSNDKVIEVGGVRYSFKDAEKALRNARTAAVKAPFRKAINEFRATFAGNTAERLNAAIAQYQMQLTSDMPSHHARLRALGLQPEISDQVLGQIDGVMPSIKEFNILQREHPEFFESANRHIPIDEAFDATLAFYYSIDPELGNHFREAIIQGRVISHSSRGFVHFMQALPPFMQTRVVDDVSPLMLSGNVVHESAHLLHCTLMNESGVDALNYPPSHFINEMYAIFFELQAMIGGGVDYQKLYNDGNGMLFLQRINELLFQQTAFTNYEKEVHTLRRNKGSDLTPEEIGRIYVNVRSKDLVIEDMESGWVGLQNPFRPFILSMYIFSTLAAISLFNRMKQAQDPAEYMQSIVRSMERGGGLSPTDLLKELGIDLNDKQFWADGVMLVKVMVDRAVAEVRRKIAAQNQLGPAQ